MPKQSSYPTFTPIATDYLSGTDDPSGTPAHGNVEINSALANLLASLITDVNGANQLAQLNGSALVSVANLPNSSTSQRGIVQQATDGEVAASKVVQSNDSRLHVLNDASTANDEVFSAEKILALVDSVTAGIDHKDPVVTTTEGEGNITLSGEQTLNSVLTSASRVLVTEQTDASENGIYITDSGSWTRATDCDEDAEVTNGLTVYVTDSNSDKYGYHYVLTTSDPITVGTTVLSFAEIPLVAVSHTHSASDITDGETVFKSVREDTWQNAIDSASDGLFRTTDSNEFISKFGDSISKLSLKGLDISSTPPGALQYQGLGPRVSGSGSLMSVFGNKGYLIDFATRTKYQFVFSSIDKYEAFDVEGALDGDNLLGLGTSENYSLITGNSDSGAGFPLARNMQILSAGASPPPIILASKGDTPAAKLYDRTPTRVRSFVGDISEFSLYATVGEEGFNNIAPSSILDADGDELDSNLTQDKKFLCVKSAGRVLDGTDHTLGITSANNLGTIRFTVSGIDLTQELSVGDHILVFGSNGTSCNGKHRITAISFSTDTTIDVNTDHQTGDATTGKLRAMARLEKITSTAI